MSNSAAYAYLCALQLEGRHPQDAGAWYTTALRFRFGWGNLSEQDCPPITLSGDGRPLPAPPTIDNRLLKANRIWYYQRVRDAAECTNAVQYFRSALAAFEVDVQWAFPRDGLLQMPATAPLESHGVVMMGVGPPPASLKLLNDLDKNSADGSIVSMTNDYFDHSMIESWCFLSHADFNLRDHGNKSGVQEISREGHGVNNERLEILEIYNRDDDERIAWSMVRHLPDSLDIEEFYVRPEYRGKGYGARLVTMVQRHARKTARRPFRLWVPFCDSRSESPGNLLGLKAIAKRLGISFFPSGVRWAAYMATTGAGSEDPVEPARIPHRPRADKGKFLAFALAAITGVGAMQQQNQTPPILPRS